MAQIEPRVLKGFRDALPSQERDRRAKMQRLTHTFETFGYVPIDTPVLEYAEVLLGKGGGETDKQVYRFLDRGKRDVAMRFDLTVPFARYMARHRDRLYLPFRRYHVAKVWRGENTQRGRFREFFQCDFDIVGTEALSSDLEVLLITGAAMRALELEAFTIRISHRAIFNQFLEKLELATKGPPILRSIDKLKKIGAAGVRTLLREVIDEQSVVVIMDFLKEEATPLQTLRKIEEFLVKGQKGNPTVERLRHLFALGSDLGLEGRLVIDPSITRGLDYYTGLLYETTLDDHPDVGAICSGGRYDDLISLYSKEALPGVGGALGLDRLMAVLEEAEEKILALPPVCVLLSMDHSTQLSRYHQVASSLRARGVSTEVFPEPRKRICQFRYAERKGIPFVLLLDEPTKGIMRLKCLLDKEKSYQTHSLAEIARKIQETLSMDRTCPLGP